MGLTEVGPIERRPTAPLDTRTHELRLQLPSELRPRCYCALHETRRAPGYRDSGWASGFFHSAVTETMRNDGA